MLHIQFSKETQKFLFNLSQKKHLLQIKHKLELLQQEPFPQDSKALRGDLFGMHRVDVGEYRIIYKVINADSLLQILLIGKRNDGDVYKRMSRK